MSLKFADRGAGAFDLQSGDCNSRRDCSVLLFI